MKQYILIALMFSSALLASAQKSRAKSDPLKFKGTSILAEEKRLEEKKQNDTNGQKITLQSLGIPEDKLPTYHALIIGVSQYQMSNSELSNLEHPVKDAEKLAEVLVSKYTFNLENIHLLLNATRGEIITSLESLSEILTEKDNLLVFYAGHGFWDKIKELGYWLPSDAHPKFKSQWIANSTLIDYLGAIKSKHTLLIADACFSGSIFKSRSLDVANTLVRFNELYRDKSRKAMTSGNLTTVPDKSVFIENLLKELSENDDIFLHSRMLYSRIYEPISNNSSTLPQHGVIQNVGDDGGDFIFIKKN